MLWFLLAFATAFFSASEAAVAKRKLGDLPPLAIIAYPCAYSLPLFAGVLAFLDAPALAPGFWPVLAVLVPLNALGMLLTFWAVKISPLSLTMPFQAFTPMFVVATGFFFLGEVPSWLGVLGILTIVFGSWVLTAGGPRRNGDLLAPLKAVVAEPGSRLMLGASLVFAFAAVLGKSLLLRSDPLFAGMMFFSVHNAAVLAALFFAGRITPAALLERPAAGLLIGVMMFFHIICHFFAISLTYAAYMIAVKRLNGLIGVMYGGVMFKESNMTRRLVGAGFMALGAAIVAVVG